jgi:hypothetical protein
VERAGEPVGPYVLERRLGAGGFGAVWSGVHGETGVRHALKLIPAQDGEQVARVAREAEALARVEGHPGLVRVHSCFRAGRWLVLAMDLVEGEELGARLARCGPLAPRAAALLVRDVARAVARAHAVGVLHRDLKPQNVVVGLDGSPRVIDFGLARVETAASLTATGEVLGSPHTMAPEQAQGAAVDERADVFGLGGLLLACLTGSTPRAGGSSFALLQRAATQSAPPVRTLRPDVPRDLAAVVDGALALRPDARPRSADALADALEAFLTGASRRRRAVAAVPLCAAAALLVALVAAWRGRAEEGRLRAEERASALAASAHEQLLAWRYGLEPGVEAPRPERLEEAAAALDGRPDASSRALGARLRAHAALLRGRPPRGAEPPEQLALAALALDRARAGQTSGQTRADLDLARRALEAAAGEPADLVLSLRAALTVARLGVASGVEVQGLARELAATCVAGVTTGVRATLQAELARSLAAATQSALQEALRELRPTDGLDRALNTLQEAAAAWGAPDAEVAARRVALERPPGVGAAGALGALRALGRVARGPPRLEPGAAVVAWLRSTEAALVRSARDGSPEAVERLLTFDEERFLLLDRSPDTGFDNWRHGWVNPSGLLGELPDARLALLRHGGLVAQGLLTEKFPTDPDRLQALHDLAPESRGVAFLRLTAPNVTLSPAELLADLAALLALDGAVEDLSDELLWEVCARGLGAFRGRAERDPAVLDAGRALAQHFARGFTRLPIKVRFLEVVADIDEGRGAYAEADQLAREFMGRLAADEDAVERLRRLRLRVFVDAGDWRQATAAFGELREPAAFDAQVARARLGRGSGDWTTCADAVRRTIEVAPASDEQGVAAGTERAAFESFHLARAAVDVALHTGQPDKARRLVAVALVANPGDPELLQLQAKLEQ